MFERLEERAERLAEGRAEARRNNVAERLAEASGVAVSVDGEQVVLRGRGVVWRMLFDPAVRWMILEGRDA